MSWCCCFLELVSSVLIIYALYFIFLKVDPQPLCGIYSQPGRWFLLKYGVFRAILRLRKRGNQSTKGGAGYGVKSKSDPAEMERPQTLPTDQPLAVDAVYFNASNASGQYLVAATARRPGGVVQTVFMIYTPETGLLQIPVHPDTKLQEDTNNQFHAGGLKISAKVPMKTWNLSFKGDLSSSDGQTTPAEFASTWQACGQCFDFDTDMSEHAVAKSIAREPWSRAYFQRLKDAHQTHYEQFGDLIGVLLYGGKKIDLKLRGVRDHSYGNCRDWRYFHRYAMQFVHLDDGTCFNVGVVSMPNVTMSRLEFGYVTTPDGRKDPVDDCDLPLHLLGEYSEPPPSVYSFSFCAGGVKYDVQCEVLHAPVFYLGEEWEAKVYEQMCRYVVNGKYGWGFSEWEYRNLEGKRV